MSATDINIPGYIIHERLGFGGMATVYLAEQKSNKRKVALKVMSNRLGEEDVWARRFIQEAEVIAQLTHPNVVPVYDLGTHDGCFYIAMELLEAGSLKERLAEGLDVPEALKIVAGVAAGLDYAAEKGFVHRDIKPDNIMFRGNGDPVILDFGIVKQIDETASAKTQTGMIIGTAAYMSPEQAQGHELDQRSDIYSLGIVFTEMLIGRQPFQGDSDVATLLMHLKEPLPILPSGLEVFQPIIDKSLAKDPFRRYTRAREIIDHIQSLEKEIKALLEKQHIDSGATVQVQKVSGSEGKTKQINNPKPNADKVEADISQALDSAKATIQSYSVASSKRKARRAVGSLVTASFIAVGAISYLAYQQFVLAPMEREASESKRLEAEFKTQRKVADLLAQASELKANLAMDDFSKLDSVIALYREVLNLSPDNKEAETHLRSLGDKYVDLAIASIRSDDIASALSYREYAESLAPNSPKLPGLRSVIKSKRAKQIEREIVEKEIQALLKPIREKIEGSTSFSDTAFNDIQRVLTLKPQHPEATELKNKMLTQLGQSTENALAKNNLPLAKRNIGKLEKYSSDAELITRLRQQFRALSANNSTKKRLKSLEEQAETLAAKNASYASNTQLRSLYLDILGIDKGHAEAKRGLQSTLNFDIEKARYYLKQRQLAAAQQHITAIEKYHRESSALGALKAELKQQQLLITEAEQALESSEAEIAKTSSGETRRKELTMARNHLLKAKNVMGESAEYREAIESLETAYLSEIKKAMENKKPNLRDGYFADTKALQWPSDRIFRLQQIAKERKSDKKKKHVITGF